MTNSAVSPTFILQYPGLHHARVVEFIQIASKRLEFDVAGKMNSSKSVVKKDRRFGLEADSKLRERGKKL